MFGIYLFSIGLFTIIFQIHKYVLENKIINFSRYWEAKDENERLYRMSGLVSNIHHLISIPCIFYFFMFPNPEVCQDTNRWSFFNNDQCLIAVDNRMVYLSFFAAGYFTYDFIVYYIVSKDMNGRTIMIAHHTFAIGSILLGLMGGYHLIGVIMLSLLMEFSSIFLNLRNFIKKEEYGKCIPLLILASFVLGYTIFRVILLPYTFWIILKGCFIVWHELNIFRKFCFVVSIT